jgi:hypothetical protein
MNRHYHQMSGELALRLIRGIRTGTESTVINELLQTNSHTQQSTVDVSSSNSKTTTIAEEIDIVPYKCLCPYSTSSTDGNLKSHLKKLTKFVKNIPCDRPCPVNLYRHLRNYHKVDLQHAKDITRTIMLGKTIKSDDTTEISRKRIKLPIRKETDYQTTIHVDFNSVKSEEKSMKGEKELNDYIFEYVFIFR